jgi:hypothetical protein
MEIGHMEINTTAKENARQVGIVLEGMKEEV